MNRKEILNRDKTGDNIRNHIIKSGFTYEQVADFLELTTSRVIYDWISGIKMPSLSNLILLCHLFNVSVEDILVTKDVF